MTERILLVAGRELWATLPTRAFLMAVLMPVLMALIAPLGMAAAAVFAYVAFPDGPPNDEAPRPVIEVWDATGQLADPLARRLGEDFEVRLGSGEPDEAAAGLAEPDIDVDLRIVFGADAVEDGGYALFVQGEETDDRRERASAVAREVERVVGEARLVRAGLSPAQVSDALAVEGEVAYVAPRRQSLEQVFDEIAGYVVPGGALVLMFGATSLAGQGLLTSTLEEKTTRVAEVLLGAVSPVELLTGKVLGHLGVSLVFAMLWGGPTLLVLAVVASFVLGPLQVLYVLVFIALASMSWAALLGGIGGAVNDVAEARHLLGPLSMVTLVIFAVAAAAVASPDTPLAVACSLVPPTAAPVMAVRVVSSSPPPHWQVWLALLASGGFALGLLWAAGRLFRIGLLLRSSPPNLRTVLRWVVEG